MKAENTRDMTLARIATRIPASIAVFERLGLDYCCGGKRSLLDACAAAGIDADHVLSAINNEASAPSDTADLDVSAMSMTELADHIEQTHHAFVRDALARIGSILPDVIRAHAGRHPELAELGPIIEAFADDMEDHMVREERVLFPWLRRLEKRTEIQGGPPWSVRRPIICMEHDHHEAGRALATMRRLTNDFAPPAGACAKFRSLYNTLADVERDTHVHIHKENNVLFPAGVRAEEALAERSRSRNVAMSRPAFSLIELLVAVAVIAMLISVLIPALGAARASARSVECLSNTRSIAIAMTAYAEENDRGFFPTARMPGMAMNGNPPAAFKISWIYLLAPHLGVELDLPDEPTADEVRAFTARLGVCRCPEDHSQSWETMMMPRLASYGVNAYLTPNHPPYWGVRYPQVRRPSRTVLTAELTEELGMDHFMPMFWGDPPAVSNPMVQTRQWDEQTQLPKVIQHTRHAGDRANYVFTDGHAAPHPFSETWQQHPGHTPHRNWYDPRR